MAVSSNSTRMRGRIPAAAISSARVYPEAAIAFLLADVRARLAAATVLRIKAPAGARAA